MILLDTNVVSELVSPRPDHRVSAWLDNLYDTEIFITAITAAELLFGVERLPEGRRRESLATAVGEVLTIDFDGHILPFDEIAAVEYARIVSSRERAGRPIDVPDAMIAAVAASDRDSILATRNTKDFSGTGVRLVNPWEA